MAMAQSEATGVAERARVSGLAPMSVAIICKDNESTIGRTLESVKGLATEIVAVDSGSTDRTIEILSSFGARVIRSEWLGHIRTKQRALEACTCEWILCLDSDESLSAPLRSEIQRVLMSEIGGGGAARSDVQGYSMNRKTFYKGRPMNHAWQPEPRLRLVRRAGARWGGLEPHDKLELTGGVAASLRGDLRHDSFPTFSEHLRKQWQHATTMASSLHASGKRGSYVSLIVSPPGAFVKQLILKGGVLDGYAGWLAAASTAAAALIKHATLIELSRSEPGGAEQKSP